MTSPTDTRFQVAGSVMGGYGVFDTRVAAGWVEVVLGPLAEDEANARAAELNDNGFDRVDHVVLPWLAALPWKQQSIFFSSLRGPDRPGVPATKSVNRWMRSVAQGNADPSKGYMALADLPKPLVLCEELEFMPCHYVHHLADGLAVIAYGYPKQDVRETAYAYHLQIAEELFHFIPEPPDIFAWRHRDKRDGVDPAPEKPYDDRPWVHRLLPDGYQHA